MVYSRNPYTEGGTAGDKKFTGNILTLLESTLTHPTHDDGFVDAGDPVYDGSIAGIALLGAEAASDYITIDTKGVWDLSVIAVNASGNVAVAIGDPLYLTTACLINKADSGLFLGFALGEITSGTTEVISVWLAQATPGDASGVAFRGLANYEETLVAAAPAADPFGISILDSNATAVDATLAAGTIIGQQKLCVMTDASNESTVTIAAHDVADAIVATFNATDQALLLEWTGTEWVTLFASCGTLLGA